MLSKIKKWLEGALITAYILIVPVLIGGAVYLKKQVDILHDHGYHLGEEDHRLGELLAKTRLFVNNLEPRSIDPLAEELSQFKRDYKKHTHPEYKKLIQEMERLIKLVKENGEYCVKKGDIGCGS